MVRAQFDCELAEFNREPGHVHLLVNFPPKPPSPAWPAACKASPRGGCGGSSRTCDSTTGTPSALVWLLLRLVRRPRQSRPFASTSNSRPGLPDRLRSVRLHHRPEGRRTGGPSG